MVCRVSVLRGVEAAQETPVTKEQIWTLAAGTMLCTVFLLLVDAAVGTRWDLPDGFWAVPPAVFGFLGAALAFSNGRNGARDDRETQESGTSRRRR